MTTSESVETKVVLQGEDPVELLREALAELLADGKTTCTMIFFSTWTLERAPYVPGEPRGKDKEGWRVTLHGKRPFKEAEVERAANTDVPIHPSDAPSASPI